MRQSDQKLAPTQDVAAQLRVEGGFVFPDVIRSAIEGRIMLPARFEIDVGFVGLGEPQRGTSPVLVGMGTAHIGFRFAQNENWQFRSLIGVRTFSDENGTTAGFDFRYGVDIFPIRPLVVSAEITLGDLGSSFTLGARASIGLMIDAVEIYAAYENFALMPTDGSATVNLGGPNAGIRIWL